MKLEYAVIIEKDDETGLYGAIVPALPGCVSQGKTREEALKNIKEAIRGHIETLRAHGWEIPTEEKVKVAL